MTDYTTLNKIALTEFRKKDQLKSYVSILIYIESLTKKYKLTKKAPDYEKKFYEWCNDEFIYKYKNKKFNRFDVIVDTYICSKFKILIKENNFYKINRKYKKYWKKRDFENLFFIGMQNIKVFKKMIKFICESKNELKISFDKIAYAFFLFDTDSDKKFEYYYENKKEILINKAKKVVENNQTLSFRKPPSQIDFYKMVFDKKKKNKSITPEDLSKSKYNHKKDKYFKKIFLEKYPKSSNKIMEKGIWKFINNYKNVEKLKVDFVISRFKRTIEEDYKDLLSRWFFNYGLLKSRSKIQKNLLNHKIIKINKENEYELQLKNKELEFPFDFETVNNYLNNIEDNNFSFKLKSPELECIPNSAIAEYFVNLFFAYLYQIEPIKFKEYCKTKMDYKLYPQTTAPGKMPDMQFSINGTNINIETTIHNGYSNICDHELRSCKKHCIERNSADYLYFISYLKKNEYLKFENEFQSTLNKTIKTKLILNNFCLVEVYRINK